MYSNPIRLPPFYPGFHTMKRYCLPCHIIISRICLLLLAISSTVILAANIHDSAQQPNLEAAAIKRIFVYQILVNTQAD